VRVVRRVRFLTRFFFFFFFWQNFADGGVEVPREVWVVDRKLFNRTYTKMITQTDVGAISAFLKLSGAGAAEQQKLPQA